MTHYTKVLEELVRKDIKAYRVVTKNGKDRRSRRKGYGFHDGRAYRLSTLVRDLDGVRIAILRVEFH